jgi:4-aminobutyrate aminotransferase/(S)-3-amino-2-methylpropionate transaminase
MAATPPIVSHPSIPPGATGAELPHVTVRPPGLCSRAAAARLEQVECPAFGSVRQAGAEAGGTDATPIVLAAGRGANLWDLDGNRYVDLAAGFGSVLLGHGAPEVAAAVSAQGAQLVQGLGDVYSSDTKLALLERLAALHPGSSPRVLLGGSGGDAVTAAVKTAVLATGRPALVALAGAYHGLGYAPLAACGLRESYRAPFAAHLGAPVTFAPYPGLGRDGDRPATLDASLGAVEAALRAGDVAAVLVEPILGRGGCVVPPAGFLAELHALAHRHGALVIVDEVWTGLGRSGSMVRAIDDGVPAEALDLVCFGKGLGGGLPISACVGPEAIMRSWAREAPVVHTSTHAGWPLGCAAALATLGALRARSLPERARTLGARWRTELAGALSGKSTVRAVRGEGLMLGVELERPAHGLRAARAMLERGWLLLGGGRRGETLTFTPALTIEERLLEGAVAALAEVV